jgi:hypothetical protein
VVAAEVVAEVVEPGVPVVGDGVPEHVVPPAQFTHKKFRESHLQFFPPTLADAVVQLVSEYWVYVQVLPLMHRRSVEDVLDTRLQVDGIVASVCWQFPSEGWAAAPETPTRQTSTTLHIGDVLSCTW